MPPVSRKQAALFRSVASGNASLPGMSKAKASEMVSGYPTKGLPEYAPKKKKPAPMKRASRRKVSDHDYDD